MMSYDYPHPVSRTHQYKKITKPALERKRRARMNKCYEALKVIMVDALETEAENISKLEKADILELSLRHLQRLHASGTSGLSSQSPNEDSTAESRWQSGFGHCADEACRYLAALPGECGEKLARHLASGLQSTSKLNIQISQKDELSLPNPESSGISPHMEVLALTPNIPSPMEISSLPIASVHPIPPPPPLPHPSEDIPTSSITKTCNSLEKSEEKRPEDEEEIDVEGVDQYDIVWRPWW